MHVPASAELRAARAALTASAPSPPPTTDSALLALLSDPFGDVDDVRTRLADVAAHLRERADRRSVFATVYTAMTARMQSELDAGRFVDPGWVRRYLVTFGEHYRRALVAFERGDTPPPPWRFVFGASLAGRTLVIQDALCGIAAHVTHDLAFTLREAGIDPDRAAKRRDHRAVNDVLAALTDDVQRTLTETYATAGLADADRLLGTFDESVTMLGLREGRSFAWQAAAGLTDGSALARRAWRWWVRVVSTGVVALVLKPTADPAVGEALREAERGTSLSTLTQGLCRP